MLLADTLIKAGRDAPKDREFNGYRHVAHLIARAHRFQLGAEAKAAVHNLLSSRPSALIEAAPWARLPFPITWMEWTPPQDGAMIEGQYLANKAGALLRQDGDQVIRLFTCWTLDPRTCPPLDLGGVPHRYQEFFRQTNGLGISAVEGAWDIGRLTAAGPTLSIMTHDVYAASPLKPKRKMRFSWKRPPSQSQRFGEASKPDGITTAIAALGKSTANEKGGFPHRPKRRERAVRR